MGSAPDDAVAPAGHQLVPAATRLRVLAGLIDAAVALLAPLTIVGGATILLLGRGRTTSYLGDPEEPAGGSDPIKETRANDRTGTRTSTARRRVRIARAMAFGSRLALANIPSPGYRILGLRRRDASTLGPVSLSAARRLLIFDELSAALTRAVLGPDPELSPASRTAEVDPPGCLSRRARRQITGHLLWSVALAGATRGARNPRDRFSGTVVVRQR